MAIRLRTKAVNGRSIKSYQVTVNHNGKRIYKTFPTRSAAANYEDDVKEQLRLGTYNPAKDMTLSEVLTQYKQKAFVNLRRSSQQARESRFRYLEDGPLANTKMFEFGPDHIQTWIQWLKQHPTTANPQRTLFEQEFKLLRVVLYWYKDELNHKFQVPIQRRHYRMLQIRTKNKPAEQRYIAPEQVVPWLTQLSERPDPVYYDLALLMVTTGLRMGEAAGLCWDAIDLQSAEPTLMVKRTLSWDYHTKEPYFQDQTKTESSMRTIKICPEVADMLRGRVKDRIILGHRPIFVNKAGRLLSDNSIRKNFNTCFEKVNIVFSGSHILRHTFGTLALIAEKDIAPVQAILGHKNQRITEKYAKIAPLRQVDLSTKVSRLINGFSVNSGTESGMVCGQA